MKKDISYSSPVNSKDLSGSDQQPNAEECSSSCAEGLGIATGCKRFTWSIGAGKKCLYFKNDNLVEKYEFGSYSGVPRHRGNVYKIFIDNILSTIAINQAILHIVKA